MYCYIRTEVELWTVGFYDDRGNWIPESDHNTTDKAAERVNFLNGGNYNKSMKDEFTTQ